MKSTDLTKRCVFLKLQLSRLGDKRGVSSDDIEVDADKQFVKVRKVIFKSRHFDKIRSLDGEIRRFVRTECLPFDPGIHLVPNAMVEQVEEQLRAFLLLRQDYIEAFAQVMPDIIKEMPKNLRALFKEEDYKKFERVQDEFMMTWQFFMFTEPLELEEINSEIFKEERKKMANRMQEAWEEARFILREMLLELIHSLREKLEPGINGTPKRLSSSTVTHLREFLESVQLKNVTDDAELARYSEQAKRLLDGIDIEELRHTDGLRARIHGELSIIEQAVQASIEVAPKRRIRIAS